MIKFLRNSWFALFWAALLVITVPFIVYSHMHQKEYIEGQVIKCSKFMLLHNFDFNPGENYTITDWCEAFANWNWPLLLDD